MKEIRLKLLPYQRRVFQSQKPIIAFVGGTGTGKTWLAARWIVLKALEHGGEHLAISPSLKLMRRTLWKEIKKVLKEWGIDYEKNEQDMIISLPCGRIYGVPADNPERMEGVHAKSAVFDEAGQVDKRSVFETAFRRLRYHRGQLLITTTPYRWNWLKELYDKALAGDPQIELVTARTIENPYYPKDEIERARREMPEWRFRMFYEGVFTKPLGLIYPDYELVEPFEIPESWLRIRGLDFGYNHPTAVIWLARSPEGVWYAYRELKKSELTLDDLYNILKEENIPTYADPEMKQGLETLRARGLDVRPAKKDVLAGISFVQGLFKQKKLKIFSSLNKTIDELSSYSWKLDANDQPLDEPVKENDDLVDALRYALFTAEGFRATAPAYKPIKVDFL
ncbi:MAG: hypothetical protein GXO39_04760 [Thermotogae bacterium]|nr:hypothetical protein [Thermotogota bacterium]